jgi:bifunctional N-acetylglucosamine-1-phosphate-uridyltransferase/glucosamine-1-phosphate-acetyltransferase GlmU-like protein
MSSRFSSVGYKIPKYLIEVDGKPVIEHIVNLYPKDTKFAFILNEEHYKNTNIVDVLQSITKTPLIVVIPPHKKGPVHSVFEENWLIDDEEQVIINYCDFSMYWDYNHFEQFVNETDCDGCVVSYTGFHPHMLGSDNYAFCRTDENNKILEVREKQPFTDNKMSEFASTGTYYFKKGKYIKKYFKQLMDEDLNINGEYYVSLVYNLLVRGELSSLVYEVPYMLQWGTPFDLDVYNSWSNYYRKALEGQKQVKLENCTLALPMAGAGSRFSKEGYADPKPFIQVNGKNMVEQAVRCLPKTDDVIYACLKGHQSPGQNTVWINEILEGQACTTERIVNVIDPDSSILISACDNGVFYDADKFLDLVNDEDNDIIVWTYRNNYTSHLQPNAYSWVNCDGEGNVSGVDVKNFTGENPVNEYAITGTMFFRTKEIFHRSLESLYNNDNRTNGEFYVDSMLNEAIGLGYKVKNFEIDNYICWGTPNDLKTYEYWQRFFNKVDWHPYEYTKDYFTN